MKKSDDYDRLSQITSTALDAAQGKMQKLLAEEESIRTQIAALQAARHQRVADGTPAQQGAADVKWQVWIDHRREELNMELARVFVKRDAARTQLKRAFGKDQTVLALLKKQRIKRYLDQKRQVS